MSKCGSAGVKGKKGEASKVVQKPPQKKGTGGGASKVVQKRFRVAQPREWQVALRKHLEGDGTYGGRAVTVVADVNAVGKTWFTGWLYSTREKVIVVPPNIVSGAGMLKYIQMRTGVNAGWEGIVIIQPERHVTITQWLVLAPALKQVQGGLMANGREAKPSTVCVFLNEMPPASVTDDDAFNFWKPSSPVVPSV
jgi:hypothetical protein